MPYLMKNKHITRIILFSLILSLGALFVAPPFIEQTHAQTQLQTIIDNQNKIQQDIALLNERIDTLFWIVGIIVIALVFVITQLFYLKGDVGQIKGALFGVDTHEKQTMNKIKKSLNTRRTLN